MIVKFGESINMESTIATELSGNASYEELDLSAFKKKLLQGELKLVRYFMINKTMEDAIHSSERLIESIKSFGRDARVVSDVWVVVEVNIYEQAKAGVDLQYKSVGGGSARINSGSTIELGANTVIAYILHKIDWKEKAKKNWKTIAKLSEDQHI